MTGVVDTVAGVLVVAGSLLALLAGIGLHRFDDVFTRMHAATKPATLGLVFVLVGAALRASEEGAVMKLLLVAALQFVTAPSGAHMVGRAAYRAGVPLHISSGVEELGRRGASDDDVVD